MVSNIVARSDFFGLGVSSDICMGGGDGNGGSSMPLPLFKEVEGFLRVDWRVSEVDELV